MITINSRALVAKYLLRIVDPWPGEPFGQQNKGDVGVVCWQAGRAQMWQWGFGTRRGEPVADIECQGASRMMDIVLTVWTWKKHFFQSTASLTAASYTSLTKLLLIFTTVLGESSPIYANIGLSFINIYAGKHFCSYVCSAGAPLLRESVVSSGESRNLC